MNALYKRDADIYIAFRLQAPTSPDLVRSRPISPDLVDLRLAFF